VFGLRPEWRHCEIRLALGEAAAAVYRFRTLSLYDVWVLWPHIQPVYEALLRGRPITFAQHLAEILEHLSPGFTKGDDFQTKFKSHHIDLLLEFYRAQDWARIKMLADSLNEGASDAPVANSDMTAEQRFFSVCVAAARASGMSVIDFVEQRFEFCADAFMALWAAVKNDQGQEGKMSGPEFMALMHAALPQETFGAPGDRPIPDFVKEMDRQTAELDKGKKYS
jgi:hypothetical protein